MVNRLHNLEPKDKDVPADENKPMETDSKDETSNNMQEEEKEAEETMSDKTSEIKEAISSSCAVCLGILQDYMSPDFLEQVLCPTCPYRPTYILEKYINTYMSE